MSGEDITDAILRHGITADHLVAEMDRLRGAGARAATPDPERADRIRALADELEDRDAARVLVAERAAADRVKPDRVRVMPGDEFTLDLPAEIVALIGEGTSVLAMPGEGTLFAGGDGVGKSTLVQQLALARVGLKADFLGFKVAIAPKRILYLAMDRPGQIRRSLARMVSERDRAALRDRFVAWVGPLPIDPLASPHALADWIEAEFGGDISDVYVDSYKDLAPGLSEDKPGAQLNLAMQEVLARDIQWFGIHHQRKPSADRTHDYALSDIYGSRWITAGVGSVFMVLGDAGDSTVELRHVKQPAGVVGPLLVRHDHTTGSSTRHLGNTTAAAALMSEEGRQFTVRELAIELYGDDDRKFTQRVDRELKKLATDFTSGVVVEPAKKGGANGTSPALWSFRPTSPDTIHIARAHNSRGAG
jgi:hypothetical protein